MKVAHGHCPARGGSASARPARANVPIAPPVMIAAMRAWPTLKRERTRAAAPPSVRSVSPVDTRARRLLVFIGVSLR